HLDLAGGVGEAGEVVQHDVEAHARARAVGGGVAEERGGEAVGSHGAHVAFHQRLALGVGGLGVYLGRLVDHVLFRHAVDAARRHVDEPFDAGGARELGQVDRTLVVDLVGDGGR